MICRLWMAATSGDGSAVSRLNASPTSAWVWVTAAIPINSPSTGENSHLFLRFALGSSGAVNS